MPPPCPPPPLLKLKQPTDSKPGKYRVSASGYSLSGAPDELREACKAARLLGKNQSQDHRSVLLSHYSQVKPIIQDGPLCGIVALCMASQLVCKESVSVEKAYKYCHEKQYTKLGEMFSASAMSDAAGRLCECDVTLIQDVRDNLDVIIQHLIKARPVLFPYDADKNHGPGMREGRAAHWAVLTGLVIECSTTDETLDIFYTADPVEGDLYHIKDLTTLPALADLTVQQYYVCSRQGKSNHMRLWTLNDMVASSCQMKEISAEVLHDLDNAVWPPGFKSLQQDLANKAVCLH